MALGLNNPSRLIFHETNSLSLFIPIYTILGYRPFYTSRYGLNSKIYCPSRRMALAFNNPCRLIFHETNKQSKFVSTNLYHFAVIYRLQFISTDLYHFAVIYRLQFISTDLYHFAVVYRWQFISTDLYHFAVVYRLQFISTGLYHFAVVYRLQFISTDLYHFAVIYRLQFISTDLYHFAVIYRLQFISTDLYHFAVIYRLQFFSTNLYHFPPSLSMCVYTNLYYFAPINQSINLSLIRGCPRGVMVKAMDFGIVVCEFEIQSRYHVHFRRITLGKGMNPLILLAMG